MLDYSWLLVVGAALGGGVAGGAGGWLLKTLADRQHRRLVRAYVQEAVHASRASVAPPPLPTEATGGSVQRARSDARSSGASEAHEPAAEELATAVFVPGKRGPASVIRTVVPPPLPAAALQTAKEEAVDGLHTSVVEEAAWKAFSENKDAKTTAASAGVTALFNHDELARMLALEERVDLRNYADLAELLEGEERAS